MRPQIPRLPPTEVEYPESDGRPMAETPCHRQNMTDTIETLQVWFGDDPNVYVSGNMFVYYARGERNKCLAPDLIVTRGIPKVTTPQRRVYFVWKEGKVPDLVMEFTSLSTKEEDMDDKFALYQNELKVPEYFLFDPYQEHLHPPLQGYRLVDDLYVAIQPVGGRLPSEVLGLHLESDGAQLRLWDPATREWLRTPEENAQVAAQAIVKLQQADEARRKAEDERRNADEARRKAEDERRNADEARRKAEDERRNADEARRKAEDERRNADEARRKAEEDRSREESARKQAETELERLRQELAALRQSRPKEES